MAEKPQMLARMLVGQPADDAPGPWGMVGNAMPEAYQNPAVTAAHEPILSTLGSMMTLPKRAYESAEQYTRTGQYDPAPIVEAAMLPMGTGAVAGLPMRAGEAVLGAGPIRAYHGSPHDFDRFDLSKIGTGEGAQAYGHGLYFAENEGIAKSYRDALAPGFKPTLNGKPFSALDDGERTVAQWISNTGAKPEEIARISRERAAKAIKEAEDLGMGDLGTTLAQKHINTANSAERLIGQPIDIGHAPNGRMYEVNINADPAHFLDWDKPLSAQPKTVQDWAGKLSDSSYIAKKNFERAEPTGQEIWQKSRSPFAGKELGYSGFGAAGPSEAMAQAGIPGIKYLDQGSRGAGEGSSNYVVFDDKLIDILRKYGVAGVPSATLLGAALKDYQPDQPQ